MKIKAAQKKEHSLGKRLMFQELEKEFSNAENAFFSRFDRLNVADMNELRRSLEKVARKTFMVKHSLAKKILGSRKLTGADRFLDGSILVTLGAKEPQLASKTLVDFIKGHENVQLKGMILDGQIYESSFIKELAKLPSRKELLTQTAIRMNSPIQGFVMTLSGLIQSFARVLNEVQKKRAQEGSQPQTA